MLILTALHVIESFKSSRSKADRSEGLLSQHLDVSQLNAASAATL